MVLRSQNLNLINVFQAKLLLLFEFGSKYASMVLCSLMFDFIKMTQKSQWLNY